MIKRNFSEHGIVLNFVDTIPKVYSQLRTKEFVPYLSMIDVLMNNTKDEVNDLWILFV